MWLGFAVIYGGMIVGDAVLGDNLDEPAYGHTRLLNSLLYLTLPVLFGLCVVTAWMAGSGDLFGLGAAAQAHLGMDLFAQPGGHRSRGTGSAASCPSASPLPRSAPTSATNSPTAPPTAAPCSPVAGCWRSPSMPSSRSSTCTAITAGWRRPPIPPRRVAASISIATCCVRSLASRAVRSNSSASGCDTLGHGTWSLHNRYLRGWLMSAAIVAAFWLAAGPAGALVFVLSALAGRSVLEAVNYFEHYGLVRDPELPVEPRHSWNSNKRLSNAVLFNLARHSHHHAEGDAQFWQLRSYREAPTLPYGYLTCMLLVFLLPGWYRNRMTPLLLDWDRRHATPTERRLAAAANRHSGVAALQLATQGG